MRLLVLAAALAAIATAAVAQDRTPPTGILDGLRYAGPSYGSPSQVAPGPDDPVYTGSIPRRHWDR